MGGKKIDRKKQSLLSRAAKRQALIKRLTHKPVIKNVDIEAMKESFKKPAKVPSTIKDTPVSESHEDIVNAAEKKIVKPKKGPKPKKEDTEN